MSNSVVVYNKDLPVKIPSTLDPLIFVKLTNELQFYCVMWSNIINFFFNSAFDLCLIILTLASVVFNLAMTGRIFPCSPGIVCITRMSLWSIIALAVSFIYNGAQVITEIFLGFFLPS